MTPPDAPAGAARGRPRRYDTATEQRMIFDAALTVMRRRGYEGATVADILAEAGMSTRAFYRHFQSKDELVCAMFRRDAEAAAERLTARVRAAASHRDALEAWVDTLLGFRRDPATADRVAVLGSAEVMRAAGARQERQHASKLIVASLVELLEAGHRDGTFPAAELPADAQMIQAVVWDAAGLAGLGSAGGSRLGREDARRSVLSFCLRALGAPETTTKLRG